MTTRAETIAKLEQFIDREDLWQGRVAGRVNWMDLKNEYLVSKSTTFIPKKNTSWNEVEIALVSILIERSIVSPSPVDNYLILRGGNLWGLYSTILGRVFFTDKDTARGYANAFCFKHGSLDSEKPIIIRGVEV